MNRFFGMLAFFFITQTATAGIMDYRQLMSQWNHIVGGRAQLNLNTRGTINGGGGSGMVCTSQYGSKSVRLLDMIEATQLWNLQEINFSPATEDEAFDFLAEKLANHFWNPWTISKAEMKARMIDMLKEFLKGAKFLKPGQDLNPVDDVHTPISDPNCQLVQIAMFYDESQFLIDTDLWDQMTWLDRAALIGHEIIYLQGRLNGETDSINTRKFISYLFSTRGLVPIGQDAPASHGAYASCNASLFNNGNVNVASLFAYETETAEGLPRTKFVFTSLDGKLNIFRTDFTFGVSLDEFMAGSGGNVTVEYDLNIDTFPYYQNRVLITERTAASGDVSRTLSYFNQNGVLLGGPWALDCYR